MRIHLFVPCFVDHFSPEVAWACVRILQRLGHEVIVPETQTCCGQPGYNSGYLEESVEVARQWLSSFAEAEAVVGSSGSCVAFVRSKFPSFFADTPLQTEAAELASRTWELSSFLVDVLGIDDLGAHYEAKATFHDGCHGLRELGLGKQARQLLAKVDGLELIEMNRTDLCCGFGGTFSVKLPELSVAMADAKLKEIEATGANLLISTEPTCLSQLISRARRRGLGLRSLHLATVLEHEADERRVGIR